MNDEDRVEQVIREHQQACGTVTEVLEIVAVVLGGLMVIAAILGGAALLGLL